jgi:hypothetical protein
VVAVGVDTGTFFPLASGTARHPLFRLADGAAGRHPLLFGSPHPQAPEEVLDPGDGLFTESGNAPVGRRGVGRRAREEDRQQEKEGKRKAKTTILRHAGSFERAGLGHGGMPAELIPQRKRLLRTVKVR